jgi:hypothetical protein
MGTPIHAIILDYMLKQDTAPAGKTLTITLGQIYTGSATPPAQDFPSFTDCQIPEEFRTVLLAWLS